MREGFQGNNPGRLLCSMLEHHPKHLLHDQSHVAGQAFAEHDEQLFYVPQLFSFKVEHQLPAFHVWLQAGPHNKPSACAPGHSSQMVQ